MAAPKFAPYFSDLYQEVLVEALDQVRERAEEIGQLFLASSGLQLRPGRAHQFVLLATLQVVFALPTRGTHRLFSNPAAGAIRAYLTNLAGTFPGGSSVIRRLRQVREAHGDAVVALGRVVLDALQVGVGTRARAALKAHHASSRAKVTAPPECFTGVIVPSVAFPQLTPGDLARVVPFLNARLYMAARRYSSVAELVGDLKTPALVGGTLRFELAGRLGFVDGPPGKNEFYWTFAWIEANLGELDEVVNHDLAKLGIHDLTFASVDSTNVPVDERDRTGAVGTGSRGTFFGHKASIGAGANCLPVSIDVAPGRVADSTLFSATFQPVVDLARASAQDLWVVGADAGYSQPGVLDEIEAAGAVPLVDLNAKNSARLQRLNATKRALVDLSRRALKANTTPAERKRWLAEAKAHSSGRAGFVPLAEKKHHLRDILRKVADRVTRRRKGLTPGEWRTVKRLRREMAEIRAEIRNEGTVAEQRLALQVVMHGTVEWLLAYGLRGQNEGINGIAKKRGDLIGDGQHTSWVVGGAVVGARARADLTCIRVSAWVQFHATGDARHPLRALHNWTLGRRGRSSRGFFMAWFIVIFCR